VLAARGRLAQPFAEKHTLGRFPEFKWQCPVLAFFLLCAGGDGIFPAAGLRIKDGTAYTPALHSPGLGRRPKRKGWIPEPVSIPYPLTWNKLAG